MAKISYSLLLTLLALVCVGAYSSCDVFAYNSYNIQNNTDTAIEVRVYRKSFSKVHDSVFVIPKDAKEEVHLVGYKTSSGYRKNTHDIIAEFDSLHIYKRGVLSNRNYLSNDTWSFTKKAGIYTAIVTGAEF